MDAYTKLVLTVIAICLVAIVLQGVDLIPAAHAQGEQAPPLAGAGVYQVQIVSVASVPGMSFEPLPTVAAAQAAGKKK